MFEQRLSSSRIAGLLNVSNGFFSVQRYLPTLLLSVTSVGMACQEHEIAAPLEELAIERIELSPPPPGSFFSMPPKLARLRLDPRAIVLSSSGEWVVVIRGIARDESGQLRRSYTHEIINLESKQRHIFETSEVVPTSFINEDRWLARHNQTTGEFTLYDVETGALIDPQGLDEFRWPLHTPSNSSNRSRFVIPVAPYGQPVGRDLTWPERARGLIFDVVVLDFREHRRWRLRQENMLLTANDPYLFGNTLLIAGIRVDLSGALLDPRQHELQLWRLGAGVEPMEYVGKIETNQIADGISRVGSDRFTYLSDSSTLMVASLRTAEPLFEIDRESRVNDREWSGRTIFRPVEDNGFGQDTGRMIWIEWLFVLDSEIDPEKEWYEDRDYTAILRSCDFQTGKNIKEIEISPAIIAGTSIEAFLLNDEWMIAFHDGGDGRLVSPYRIRDLKPAIPFRIPAGRTKRFAGDKIVVAKEGELLVLDLAAAIRFEE